MVHKYSLSQNILDHTYGPGRNKRGRLYVRLSVKRLRLGLRNPEG